MKVLKSLMAAVALVVCTTGTAQAVEYSQTYNPGLFPISIVTPHSYTHDMREVSGLPGVKLNSAFLELGFVDAFGPERLVLTLNDFDTRFITNVPFGSHEYVFDVVTTLQDTGVLDVTISVIGIFEAILFNYSTLTIDVEPFGPSEVPEPATLLTLGAGLLGLAATRRRKQHKG